MLMHSVPLPHSNEVDLFLTMGPVQLNSFLDVIQWWGTQREALVPNHYQLAMDIRTTLTISTSFERVNSMTGQEFTTAARKLLSSEIFVETRCLYSSWMKTHVIMLPDR